MLCRDLKNLDTEHTPALIRLRWATIFAALGNGLTGVVLTITIAENLGAFATSAALTALSVGMLFSFASGGIHADSANRVQAIVRSDILRFLANAMILSGVLAPEILGTVLVASGCLINGLCAGYFRPAQSSLWSTLVPLEQLKTTLATNALYNRVFLALGGALGGMLIAMRLSTWGLALDALTFLLTALIVRTIDDPRYLPSSVSSSETDKTLDNSVHKIVAQLNVLCQWATLLAVAKKSCWLPLWVRTSMINSFVAGITQVCLPIVLVEHYTSQEIGFFQSAGVVALLAGAVISRMLLRLPVPGMFHAWVEIGSNIAAGLIAMMGSISVATASRFSGYFCSSLVAPVFGKYIADQFDDSERGKVFAIQTGVSSVLAPFGMLAASLLLLLFPATQLLLICSALSMVLAALPLVRKQTWTFALTTA